MESFDLVCFGEVLYDIYKTKKVLAGAPLNVASFASFLGLKTALISAIGNNSKDIEKELTKRGVQPFLQKNIYPTGKAKIELNKKGIPTYSIDKESAYDHIRKTKNLVNLVKNNKFFYFGTLSQRHEDSRITVMELLSATEANTVYDVNLRNEIPAWQSVVKTSLSFTSILKMNEQESDGLKKTFGCKDLEQLFADTAVDYMFVTSGERGAYLYQKEEKPIFVSAPQVNVVDTTGCGDAFTAAIIFGFQKKRSILRILEFAVNFSSNVAQYESAFDSEFLDETGILSS
jgi:fructokinase